MEAHKLLYCGFNLMSFKRGNEHELNDISAPMPLNDLIGCDESTVFKSCSISWRYLVFITDSDEIVCFPDTKMSRSKTDVFHQFKSNISSDGTSNDLTKPSRGTTLSNKTSQLSQITRFTTASDEVLYIIGVNNNIITFNFDNLCETFQLSSTEDEHKLQIVQLIHCSDKRLFAISDNGKIGEITIKIDDHTWKWNLFNLSIKITSVSCGKEHILVLTTDNQLLSFGNGSRGQLGNGSHNIIEQPEVIPTLNDVKIIQISAGGWHSVAITDIGDVYTWGWNRDGQLGFPADIYPDSLQNPDIVSVQYTPMLVSELEDQNAVKSACGSRHTVILTDTGNVYSTGWNDYGQLCHGDFVSRDCFTRVKHVGDGRVSDILSAYWSTIIVL